MQLQGLLLLEALLTHHPLTCFKCHPALLLCVGAVCSQARELLEGRDGSSSMILALVTGAGQLVGARCSLSEQVN